MSEGLEAAKAKVGIWRAHDNRDEDELRSMTADFFGVITDSRRDELEYAGEMMRRAFWLADEGEKYQGEDAIIENHFYECAQRCLEEVFGTVGLEESIAEYRRDWWQGYRHGEIREKSIEKDLELVLGNNYENRDTERLLKASEAHDGDNWELASKFLEPIYSKVT